MAKNLYVDTDNNRLLAGSLTTQLATRPVFYAGNTETVTVDLIERDSLQNLTNLVQPAGTTVALRVGVPGNVISVPSLSATVQAGITATATCSLFTTATATGTASLYSGVTATVTAALFGNITALATAAVTRGTACTLSLSVVTVKTPVFSMGVVSMGPPGTQVSSSTHSKLPFFNYTEGAMGGSLPQNYVEIDDPGSGLYGSPRVFMIARPTATPEAVMTEVTEAFTFLNGKCVAINPGADLADMNNLVGSTDFTVSVTMTSSNISGANSVSGPYFNTMVSQGFVIVPDPDFLYCAESVSIASAGTGFPDGVDIPFSIPSDQDGDGRPCTGFLRAVNGSVVSVVSISSRGGRFTSSTTAGKNSAVQPPYKISSLTVTCAGAGYWGAAPAVVVDDLYFDSSSPGATQAQVTAVTVPGGQVTLQLTNAGLGYTTAPNIRIAAPRISDGVRTATLTNTPTGYAIGTYACTVSGPAAGVTASVNLVVTAGGLGLVVADPGSGYTSAPTVLAPAPNLTGSVASVTVTCQGTGYTTTPAVTFTGNGSGAAGTAVLSGGKVVGVTITTYGSGYSGAVTVSFAAPANQGRIQSISVLSGGTNYLTAPTIAFAGSGGAAATAIISNGSVTSIFLTDAGSGYASAPTVTVSASPSRTVYSGVLSVTTAFVNAILPSTAVTVQVQATTTIGTSTLLQVQGTVAASL